MEACFNCDMADVSHGFFNIMKPQNSEETAIMNQILWGVKEVRHQLLKYLKYIESIKFNFVSNNGEVVH